VIFVMTSLLVKEAYFKCQVPISLDWIKIGIKFYHLQVFSFIIFILRQHMSVLLWTILRPYNYCV
jgi:hypothetical protein